MRSPARPLGFAVLLAALAAPPARAADPRVLPAQELRRFAEGNPVDLAWSDRQLAVLDRAASTLSLFSPDGKLARRVAGPGADPGQLAAPSGLDADFDGNLYVADTGNRRVQVFAPEGQLIRSLALAELGEPVDVAVVDSFEVGIADAAGQLLLVDLQGKRTERVPAPELRFLAHTTYEGLMLGTAGGVLRSLSHSHPRKLEAVPAVAMLRRRASLTHPGRIVSAGERIYVADLDRPRLLELGEHFELRGVIELPAPAQSAAGGHRDEMPSVYVADGHRVIELGFAVDSPLPVFEALRADLERRDIEAALEHIHPLQRPLFREIYRSIEADLPLEARAMKNVRIRKLRDDEATLVIERALPDGATNASPVLCVRMPDGTWKIVDY